MSNCYESRGRSCRRVFCILLHIYNEAESEGREGRGEEGGIKDWLTSSDGSVARGLMTAASGT